MLHEPYICKIQALCRFMKPCNFQHLVQIPRILKYPALLCFITLISSGFGELKNSPHSSWLARRFPQIDAGAQLTSRRVLCNSSTNNSPKVLRVIDCAECHYIFLKINLKCFCVYFLLIQPVAKGKGVFFCTA